jgi:hypothetical protein
MQSTKILILMTFLSSSVLADIQESCNAVLSSGIRDNYFVFSKREQFELFQKRLCDTQYNKYSDFKSGTSEMGVDVPFAEGLIGLTGSAELKSNNFSETYKKYCESNFFNYSQKDQFISYSSKVNSSLTESWLACQKSGINAWLTANQKGIFISATPSPDLSTFAITVNRKNSVSTQPIKINDILPSSISCTRGKGTFGVGSTVDQNEFQFECTKPPSKQIDVSIDTTDGVSNKVMIPAITSRLDELQDSIDALTEKNSVLSQKLSSRVDRIVSGKGCIISSPALRDVADEWQEFNCPTGSYLRSIHFHHPRGKDYIYQEQVRLQCCSFE